MFKYTDIGIAYKVLYHADTRAAYDLEIGPENIRTHYETLGVNKDSRLDEIRRAYLNLAKIHHPDKNNGDDRIFKKIQAAHEILSSPIRRTKYNTSLLMVNKFQPKAAPKPSPGDCSPFDQFWRESAEREREKAREREREKAAAEQARKEQKERKEQELARKKAEREKEREKAAAERARKEELRKEQKKRDAEEKKADRLKELREFEQATASKGSKDAKVPRDTNTKADQEKRKKEEFDRKLQEDLKAARAQVSTSTKAVKNSSAAISNHSPKTSDDGTVLWSKISATETCCGTTKKGEPCRYRTGLKTVGTKSYCYMHETKAMEEMNLSAACTTKSVFTEVASHDINFKEGLYLSIRSTNDRLRLGHGLVHNDKVVGVITGIQVVKDNKQQYAESIDVGESGVVRIQMVVANPKTQWLPLPSEIKNWGSKAEFR